MADIATITREELKKKMDERQDFILVETLAKNAYEHAHLPGAINLPPDELRRFAPQLLPDQDAEIIVYCASPT